MTKKEQLRQVLTTLPWAPLKDLGGSLQDDALDEYWHAIRVIFEPAETGNKE